MEKELIHNPFNFNMEEKFKPAMYSEAEIKKFQDEYNKYQMEVSQLGFKMTETPSPITP